MADGMKSDTPVQDEVANVQNEDEFPSSSDDDSKAEPSEDDNDDIHSGRNESVVARIDPFSCDIDKRAQLMAFIAKLDRRKRLHFMTTPLPKDVWLECYIDRIKTGITKFSRMFAFHVDHDNTFLAKCVKRKHNRSANYQVTTDPHGDDRSNKLGWI